MASWPDSICIFCGASRDLPARHLSLARRLARLLVAEEVTVIYGGGKQGLMGALADEVIAAGGELIGIIPEFLVRVEVAHPGVEHMLVVESMHARKRLMAERSDAFCVLPGGIGTLEEAVEMMTWGQLGLHAKPLVFLDPDGFWDDLERLFLSMQRQHYLRVPTEETLYRVTEPEAVLDCLRSIRPAITPELLQRS